jgi:thioredoxin 1
VSHKVELIDFYADWCGPCRTMKPIIEEIEKTYADQIHIAKYNIDEHQDVASENNVMSIPTILIKKDGQVVNQLVGAQPKAALIEAVKSALY